MDQDKYSALWNDAISTLKKGLSFSEISTWIEVIHYQSSQDDSIIVAVPSHFHRDQIMQKYSSKLEKLFFNLSNEKITLQIVVDASIDTDDENDEDEEKHKTNTQPIQNEEPEKKERHPDLNENYTFDNFVIGSGNLFVANAAISIAKNLSDSMYNPFFIYGGVGLGKTHLLQAIANQVWKNTKLKVLYVTAETFVTEFIQALKSPDRSGVVMASFKKKYRNVDMLLIDDVQLLEGKIESQEEIHNTLFK